MGEKKNFVELRWRVMREIRELCLQVSHVFEEFDDGEGGEMGRWELFGHDVRRLAKSWRRKTELIEW